MGSNTPPMGRPPGRRRRGQRGRGGSSSPAQRAFERALLERIQSVVGGVAYREIAEQTWVHPETVRRYVTQGRPSVFFVAAMCRAFCVSPSWLLGLAGRAARANGRRSR